MVAGLQCLMQLVEMAAQAVADLCVSILGKDEQKMKYAIIENGVVVNIAESESALESNWVPGKHAKIGDIYADGQFTTPAPVVDPLEYQKQRAAEYPPMTDYLDGIVKGDQGQVQAYVDACLAVKAKYPKPN